MASPLHRLLPAPLLGHREGFCLKPVFLQVVFYIQDESTRKWMEPNLSWLTEPFHKVENRFQPVAFRPFWNTEKKGLIRTLSGLWTAENSASQIIVSDQFLSAEDQNTRLLRRLSDRGTSLGRTCTFVALSARGGAPSLPLFRSVKDSVLEIFKLRKALEESALHLQKQTSGRALQDRHHAT